VASVPNPQTLRSQALAARETPNTIAVCICRPVAGRVGLLARGKVMCRFSLIIRVYFPLVIFMLLKLTPHISAEICDISHNTLTIIDYLYRTAELPIYL